MAESQAIAAGELRRLAFAADELIDHLAFADLDLAQSNGKPQLFGLDPYLHRPYAYLAREGVVAAIPALSRISQGQQEPFIAARQRLQALRPAGGKIQRLAGYV